MPFPSLPPERISLFTWSRPTTGKRQPMKSKSVSTSVRDRSEAASFRRENPRTRQSDSQESETGPVQGSATRSPKLLFNPVMSAGFRFDLRRWRCPPSSAKQVRARKRETDPDCSAWPAIPRDIPVRVFETFGRYRRFRFIEPRRTGALEPNFPTANSSRPQGGPNARLQSRGRRHLYTGNCLAIL